MILGDERRVTKAGPADEVRNNQGAAAKAAEVRLAPLDHPAAPEWMAVKGAEGEGKARPLTAGQTSATHSYLRFFYYILKHCTCELGRDDRSIDSM